MDSGKTPPPGKERILEMFTVPGEIVQRFDLAGWRGPRIAGLIEKAIREAIEHARAEGKKEGHDEAFAECIEAAHGFCEESGSDTDVARRILHSLASRSGNDGEPFAHREYWRGLQDGLAGRKP